MIEKLDLEKRKSFGLLDWFAHNGEPSGAGLVGSKINELVDAVNDITDWIKRTDETIVKYGIKPIENTIISKMENVDPYAEQRKWIGKLCKFWDIDNDNLYYGPLTKIWDTEPYCYECNHRVCYVHCEPVKDDIIYKGGDNE